MKAGLMDLSLYKMFLIEKKMIAESTTTSYVRSLSAFLKTNLPAFKFAAKGA